MIQHGLQSNIMRLWVCLIVISCRSKPELEWRPTDYILDTQTRHEVHTLIHHILYKDHHWHHHNSHNDVQCNDHWALCGSVNVSPPLHMLETWGVLFICVYAHADVCFHKVCAHVRAWQCDAHSYLQTLPPGCHGQRFQQSGASYSFLYLLSISFAPVFL